MFFSTMTVIKFIWWRCFQNWKTTFRVIFFLFSISSCFLTNKVLNQFIRKTLTPAAHIHIFKYVWIEYVHMYKEIELFLQIVIRCDTLSYMLIQFTLNYRFVSAVSNAAFHVRLNICILEVFSRTHIVFMPCN